MPSSSHHRHKLMPLAGVGVILLIQGWVSKPAVEVAITHRVHIPEQGHPFPNLVTPQSEARIPVELEPAPVTEIGPNPLTSADMAELLPALEPTSQRNTFLNRNLQAVGEVFPEMYERYLSAPPHMRVNLAPALQTYSMTIILSASGEGPLPEGHSMEGVLTGADLDALGRSAFYINDCTFQYHVDRFPEVQQYRRNRAGQRHFGRIGFRPQPLSFNLNQAIVDRAAEAFSYLD